MANVLAIAVVAGAILPTGPAALTASADTMPSNGSPATVSADPLPTVQIDGVAWTQVVVGDRVFVGGDFSAARPAGAAPGQQTAPRANMLAYDIRTGELDPGFAPSLNGQVLSLSSSPDGRRIYAGGDFTSVDGQARARVAAFDAGSGALLGFAPAAGGTVRSVLATGSTVYLGGDFRTMNGEPRPFAAAVGTGGALLDWAPRPDALVATMTLNPDRSLVVLGGRFASMGGRPARGIAAVGTTDARLRPWEASTVLTQSNDSAGVTSVVSDADSVYASVFNWKGGGNLEGSMRINGSTGALEWVEDCHGDHYSVYPADGVLYVASHSHYCGNIGGFGEASPPVNYHSTALTTAATSRNTYNPIYEKDSWEGYPSPSLLHWFPRWERGTFTGQNQATWNVTGNGDYVVYAGEFTAVNGQPQQGLVRFAGTERAPNRSGPRSGRGLTPSVVSARPGVVDVGWQATSDQDNRSLTYSLLRNGTVVHRTTVDSTPWHQPTLTFRDTGLPPGQAVRYRVSVADPAGNTVTGGESVATVAGADYAYQAAVLQSDPEHWFRLGEGEGGTLLDSRGAAAATGARGLVRGVPGATSGGTATSFPGREEGTAATEVAMRGPQRFSVEAWLQTTAAGRLIGFGDYRDKPATEGRSDRHLYVDAAGRIRFGVSTSMAAGLERGSLQTVASAPGFNDGRWHHAVGTLDADGMKLYVDGSLVAARAEVTRARDISGYWRIGGDQLTGWADEPGNDYFRGALDEVAVYHRALSAQEVAAHFAAANGAVPATSAVRALRPSRLADTRSTAILRAGRVLQVDVAGVDGVPRDAAGASLNVTVTQPQDRGHLTVFPCGQNPPTASNLNFAAGQTIANAVLSGIGTGGQVCLVGNATTHVVVDVNGWVPAGADYAPITPARLIDTRTSGRPLAAGGELRVRVSDAGGVPDGQSAASLNVTVTAPTAAGHLTVHPCGTPVPTASNLNFVAGQTVPNAVITGVGSGGEVCIASAATTHVVVDVNGSFGPAAGFVPVTPDRLVDTRTTGPVPAGGVLRVEVGGSAARNASAVSLNVTATASSGTGYLTVFPCGETAPTASNLNMAVGRTVPNAVVTGTSPDGAVCIRASASTHVIVDLNGFAPG